MAKVRKVQNSLEARAWNKRWGVRGEETPPLAHQQPLTLVYNAMVSDSLCKPELQPCGYALHNKEM